MIRSQTISRPRRARLGTIDLPDLGRPAARPELPSAVYAARLARLRAAMAAADLDRLVIWADREHAANLAWLTGFDPRFEDAILVVRPDGDPAMLVGNECFGMAGVAPLPMHAVLQQELSLPSQPRDRSAPLRAQLRAEGIGAGVRVGAIGWKVYGDPAWIDLPAYLADLLRELVAPSGKVTNATGLLIDPGAGLRVVNEPDVLPFSNLPAYLAPYLLRPERAMVLVP